MERAGVTKIAGQLVGKCSGGEQPFSWIWILNAVVWLAIFVAGAVWRFRRGYGSRLIATPTDGIPRSTTEGDRKPFLKSRRDIVTA